ncbi:MAG: nucleotidyltransferase family protein [Bacteroidetes bacterium]|nr:nucleotidyltransferase family protein [Bacteroidota bacterium]
MKYGVTKIGLFGSASRGEAMSGSDIDILIDFEPEKETFENLMNTCYTLESVFPGENVDIVTEKGLSPYVGPYILKEVEYV